MKLFLALLLAVVGVCLAEHHEWGIQGPNDKLYEARRIILTLSPFASRDETVRFPQRGEYPGAITHIKATDLDNNGVSRYADVTKGGVGHKVAYIKFHCPPWRGLEYEVEIHGPK